MVVAPDDGSKYLTHLFSHYMARQSFAHQGGVGGTRYRGLQDLIHSSTSLQNVALAVGALDYNMSKKAQSPAAVISATAFRYYHESVTSLQREISQIVAGTNNSDAILWSTILLALFDTISDASGHGSVAHFVNGTLRLLRSHTITPTDPMLYHVVRLLEICCVLAVYEGTFWPTSPSEPQRQICIPGPYDPIRDDTVDGTSEIHPMDTLIDMARRLITFYERCANNQVFCFSDPCILTTLEPSLLSP